MYHQLHRISGTFFYNDTNCNITQSIFKTSEHFLDHSALQCTACHWSNYLKKTQEEVDWASLLAILRGKWRICFGERILATQWLRFAIYSLLSVESSQNTHLLQLINTLSLLLWQNLSFRTKFELGDLMEAMRVYYCGHLGHILMEVLRVYMYLCVCVCVCVSMYECMQKWELGSKASNDWMPLPGWYLVWREYVILNVQTI